MGQRNSNEGKVNITSMRLLQLIITVLLTILRCTRGAPEELSKFHSDQPVVATDGSIDVNKIVGGTEATANEFPFIVSLQNYVEGGQSYRHFCGGSVYNQNYIITAAHCVTPDKLSSTLSLIIVAGDHDLNTGSYSEQIRVVKTIYLHPRYSEVSYANDIAVLELQSPLTFNQWVTPIAIATTDPPELSLVTTSGWGRMRVNMTSNWLSVSKLHSFLSILFYNRFYFVIVITILGV